MEVKILQQERLLSGFFNVDVATVRYEKFSGGMSAPVKRYNLNRGEAVAALIYLQDVQRLVLIRQFRYADFVHGGSGWIDEIAAGVVDEGESPLECVKRETIEETGYEVNDFRLISSVYSTPGITSERIHIYLGVANSNDLKHKGGGLDTEHEDIKLLEWSPEEARHRLIQGQLVDAKTILALQYFFLQEFVT